MMPDGTVDFLRGGSFVAFLGVALFFLRSWLTSKDFFFATFAGAFALMALAQPLVLATGEHSETGPIAYWLRVTAFLLIIVGIVSKNLPRSKTKSEK
ncbi:MAG: DUF5985 family protein [Candidatus Obscuribacterales bacterium]